MEDVNSCVIQALRFSDNFSMRRIINSSWQQRTVIDPDVTVHNHSSLVTKAIRYYVVDKYGEDSPIIKTFDAFTTTPVFVKDGEPTCLGSKYIDNKNFKKDLSNVPDDVKNDYVSMLTHLDSVKEEYRNDFLAQGGGNERAYFIYLKWRLVKHCREDLLEDT